MSYAEDLLGSGFKNWSPIPVTGPQIAPPDVVKRERGASNIPMAPLGKHQLQVRGSGFAQQIRHNAMAHGRMPKVQIHTSTWDRTKDSADQMYQQLATLGIPAEMNIVPELAPRSLGELEGQESDKVAPELDRYNNDLRDVPPPGVSPLTGLKGESANHYADRIVPYIDKLVIDSARYPSTIHIVSAHSSDMREARRAYDPTFDGHDDIAPARTDLIHIGNDVRPHYVPDVTIGGDRKLIPGVYLQHHGATEFNIAHPASLLAQILPRRDQQSNPSNSGNASGTPPPTGQY